MHRSLPSGFALAAAFLIISPPALAASGTALPLDQYQAGTEVVNTSIVTNGGFETVIPATMQPEGWTPVGSMRAGSHFGDPPAQPVVGSRAAQGVYDPQGVATNQYLQTVSDLPAGQYVLSAYLWNRGFVSDLGFGSQLVQVSASAADSGAALGTINIGPDDPVPAGVNSYGGGSPFFVFQNFEVAPGASGDVLVSVEIGNNEGLFSEPVAGQIDNVAITPASAFQSPSALPEPVAVVVLALAGLAAKRSPRSSKRYHDGDPYGSDR